MRTGDQRFGSVLKNRFSVLCFYLFIFFPRVVLLSSKSQGSRLALLDCLPTCQNRALCIWLPDLALEKLRNGLAEFL